MPRVSCWDRERHEADERLRELPEREYFMYLYAHTHLTRETGRYKGCLAVGTEPMSIDYIAKVIPTKHITRAKAALQRLIHLGLLKWTKIDKKYFLRVDGYVREQRESQAEMHSSAVSKSDDFEAEETHTSAIEFDRAESGFDRAERGFDRGLTDPILSYQGLKSKKPCQGDHVCQNGNVDNFGEIVDNFPESVDNFEKLSTSYPQAANGFDRPTVENKGLKSEKPCHAQNERGLTDGPLKTKDLGAQNRVTAPTYTYTFTSTTKSGASAPPVSASPGSGGGPGAGASGDEAGFAVDAHATAARLRHDTIRAEIESIGDQSQREVVEHLFELHTQGDLLGGEPTLLKFIDLAKGRLRHDGTITSRSKPATEGVSTPPAPGPPPDPGDAETGGEMGGEMGQGSLSGTTLLAYVYRMQELTGDHDPSAFKSFKRHVEAFDRVEGGGVALAQCVKALKAAQNNPDPSKRPKNSAAYLTASMKRALEALGGAL